MTDQELQALIQALKDFAVTVVRESINSSKYGSWNEEKSLEAALRVAFKMPPRIKQVWER